ncbi:hypothetical protein [Micromonospora sp. NPDC000442]|uniref:hypothetical protein n=1 Tax=Micromonospora sp. NPDC000442 TaxID=3364217 RepID=UPI0036A54BF2
MLARIIGGAQPYYDDIAAWATMRWPSSATAAVTNGVVVFTADGGVFIRVSDHESAKSPCRDPDQEMWPELLNGLPLMLRPQVNQPAFGDEAGQFVATAALWRFDRRRPLATGDGIAFPPQAGRTTPVPSTDR